MSEPIATYQSYLVRLWQDSPHASWRASAQSVQTSEIVHFADLDALFIFLWGQVERARPAESVTVEKWGMGP